ncbi:protease complex subunit PrcB family protein [Azospirillum doebereinerae]|uniref:Protease complex subunit PrcB family protein n=1 Tax=Azospirillum doebereinerae TaxID=92933 RepID=A0A3S0WWC9_9PROT|nr:protease complex subunit PrcB family protein [Azospirillum doebereinerae]MCG5242421.1 protease complex subunit PrcB family protein [Azospirillum doebereinerae]RUQ66118.1 protease complex subunit PrcB family protein [Azospirillum doebereinerae]
MTTRRILAPLALLGALSLAAGLTACQTDGTGEEAAGNLLPAVAASGTAWQGDRSLAAERAYVTASNAQEWTELWARVGEPAPASLPSDRMAVAVFLGPRDTAGYTVSIDRAQTAGGELQVGFHERVPGPAQAVALSQTSPYAIRLLPRVEAKATFHRDK